MGVFPCTSEGNLLLRFSTFIRQFFPLGLSTFSSPKKNSSSPNAVSEKCHGFPPVLRDVHKIDPAKMKLHGISHDVNRTYPPQPHPLPNRVADIVTNPSRSQHRTAFHMTSLVHTRHTSTPPPPCCRHRDKPRGSPAPHAAQAPVETTLRSRRCAPTSSRRCVSNISPLTMGNIDLTRNTTIAVSLAEE